MALPDPRCTKCDRFTLITTQCGACRKSLCVECRVYIAVGRWWVCSDECGIVLEVERKIGGNIVLNDEISRLPRQACIELLASVSIQSYDHETLAELREAVQVNVDDGTLAKVDVLSAIAR